MGATTTTKTATTPGARPPGNRNNRNNHNHSNRTGLSNHCDRNSAPQQQPRQREPPQSLSSCKHDERWRQRDHSITGNHDEARRRRSRSTPYNGTCATTLPLDHLVPQRETINAKPTLGNHDARRRRHNRSDRCNHGERQRRHSHSTLRGHNERPLLSTTTTATQSLCPGSHHERRRQCSGLPLQPLRATTTTVALLLANMTSDIEKTVAPAW